MKNYLFLGLLFSSLVFGAEQSQDKSSEVKKKVCLHLDGKNFLLGLA